MISEDAKTDARIYFAGLAMQAALGRLLGAESALTPDEVLARHKQVTSFAWHSADRMLAAEVAESKQDLEAADALGRLLRFGERAAQEMRDKAGAIIEEAQTSDAPGVTARSRMDAGELSSRATRIESDVALIRERNQHTL